MSQSIDTKIAKLRADAMALALRRGDRKTVDQIILLDRVDRMRCSNIPGHRTVALAILEQVRVIVVDTLKR